MVAGRMSEILGRPTTRDDVEPYTWSATELMPSVRLRFTWAVAEPIKNIANPKPRLMRSLFFIESFSFGDTWLCHSNYGCGICFRQAAFSHVVCGHDIRAEGSGFHQKQP